MPDMGAIAAALSSLKAAKDIGEAMISLRDTAAFQTKLIEFQGKLIDANNAAFAAHDERTALLERIRDLEKEVADLKAWEAEKQRYELKPNYAGAVAYMLKPEARGTEPPHWRCPNCYGKGKKSFLLPTDRGPSHVNRIYKCGSCITESMMYDKPKWDDPVQESA